MRLIDADALFDELYRAWGTEIDAGPANAFMELINNAQTIAPPPNKPLSLKELREQLSAYKNTGLTPEEIEELLHKTYGPLHKKLGRWIAAEQDGRLVILPPNAPLTLEELREMDGEPVWVKDLWCPDEEWKEEWGLTYMPFPESELRVYTTIRTHCERNYGKRWLAYRRKPKEVRN